MPPAFRIAALAGVLALTASAPCLAASLDDCRLRSLEERANMLLDDALGPGRARAFLRAEGRKPPRRAALWDQMMRQMEENPPVLPGYRLPRSLAEEALRSLEALKPAPVVSALLLVDPSVKEDQLEAAFKALRTALDDPGLNAIEVQRVKLSVAAQPSAGLQALIWPIGLAACSAILGVPLLLALAFLHRRPSPPEKRPPVLAPISRRHASLVADFLKDEAPDAVAWILGSLRPVLAADVYCLLPAPLQRSTAQALLKVSERPLVPASAKTRDELEARLRDHVLRHRTGLGLMQELLLRSPEWTRDSVLSHLEAAAPETAQSLRSGLITLFSLATADPWSLKLCLSPYSTDQLALCLYDAPKSLADPILRALPETIRSLIEERRRFLVPTSLEQVERLRGEILARWKDLETQGRVPALTAERGA